MFANRGEQCRVTFIHHSGDIVRVGHDSAYVFSHATSKHKTCIAVSTSKAPDWHDESGVEVVAADTSGDVFAAFEIGDVSTVPAGDGYEQQMHEYQPG